MFLGALFRILKLTSYSLVNVEYFFILVFLYRLFLRKVIKQSNIVSQPILLPPFWNLFFQLEFFHWRHFGGIKVCVFLIFKIFRFMLIYDVAMKSFKATMMQNLVHRTFSLYISPFLLFALVPEKQSKCRFFTVVLLRVS